MAAASAANATVLLHSNACMLVLGEGVAKHIALIPGMLQKFWGEWSAMTVCDAWVLGALFIIIQNVASSSLAVDHTGGPPTAGIHLSYSALVAVANSLLASPAGLPLLHAMPDPILYQLHAAAPG